MVRTSILADAMNSINNADRMGKRQVMIRPASKVTVEFLNIMQKHGKPGTLRALAVVACSQSNDRLRRRIRDRRRPPQRQDRCPAHRTASLSSRPALSRAPLTSRSLNKCGVISPRYNVKISQMEKWVTKLLPARQFGHIVLTTSAGVMDHNTARRKHVSGKVLGFFY
ncbi:hypothetical protein CHU98_g9753 [Xylaria longipes]|nr:hypothetical protein CHU98_g9753 [Xylaria longipes]